MAWSPPVHFRLMRRLAWNLCLGSTVLWLALHIPGVPSHRAIAQTTPTRTSVPSAATDASATGTPRPLLRLGSQGTHVADVQAMLTLLGFYRGSISGQFDDTTTLAVANFQRAAGIAVDGIVGNTTWARLLPSVSSISRPVAQPSTSSSTGTGTGTRTTAQSQQETTPDSSPTTATRTPPPGDRSIPYVEFPVLRRGMRGAAVIGLQARLQALGFYLAAADGIFGQQTEEAVIAAQRQFNLRPDGVVGAATWSVITGATRN